MELSPAFSLVFVTDDASDESLGSLEEHLAMVEEQLDSIIRAASRLPAEQQDEYWALAKDLQKEIRLTRKRIELRRNERLPVSG